MIYDVLLDCGHVNHETLPNANKRPCWMVADAVPPKGAKGKCNTCGLVSTVTNTKLLQGWGE